MQSKKNHNIKDIKITFEDESAKKLEKPIMISKGNI
jgi:hypothetical protein